MLTNPVGLRSDKGTVDVRQKIESTEQTSRQRGRPTSTNPKLSKKIITEGLGSQMGA
jgi:hypothetical protein